MNEQDKISKAIHILEESIVAGENLPDDIFFLITRHTPMVNVDLLVKDREKGILLSWRDDEQNGTGWHIPGGIIRFKEDFSCRIKKTAKSELGLDVDFDDEFIAVNTLIQPPDKLNRGHFISFLYVCRITGILADHSVLIKKGLLKWHKKCPDNLISVQEFYRKYFE